MNESRGYRINAERCEAAAALMRTNALLRASYLEIARRWRELADSVDAYERRAADAEAGFIQSELRTFEAGAPDPSAKPPKSGPGA